MKKENNLTRNITRDEAINFLYKIMEFPLLDNSASESLQEIINCIEAEKEGRHEWGAKLSDLSKIYVSRHNWTREEVAEARKINDSLLFAPSLSEKEEFFEYLREREDDEFSETALENRRKEYFGYLKKLLFNENNM